MKTKDVLEINKDVFRYSYCGKFFAYGFQNKLVVKSTRHYDSCQSHFSCSDIVEYIEWSSDSSYVLCGVYSRSTVEVFSVCNESWFCRIQEGTSGLQSCQWNPMGYQVITLADYNAKLSVWSLTNRSVAYIDQPILKNATKLSFTENGDSLALLTGTLDQYKISIFSASSWVKKGEIECDGKIIIPSQPIWSPDGNYIALWETIEIRKGFIQIYSVQTNKCIKVFENREKLGGIINAQWSPSGQFLAVAFYNDSIHLLNYITWTSYAKLSHEDVLTDNEFEIYQEKSDSLSDNNVFVEFEHMTNRPVTCTSKKPDSDNNIGTSMLTFSACGSYLATKSNKMPALLWVWDINTFKLKTIIVLKNEITQFTWGFKSPRLLIASSSVGVTLWDQKPVFIRLKKDLLESRDVITKCYWKPMQDANSLSFTMCSSTAACIFENWL